MGKEGLNWQYVLVCIYDIIVITEGEYEDRVRVLHQVLERLKQLNLHFRKE